VSIISKDAYMKIQSYKRHGTSQRETARRLGLDKNTVSRWWDASEPEYDTRSQSQAVYLDQ
jgi:transposase-like protein